MDGDRAVGNVTLFIQNRFLGNGLKAGYVEDVTTHPNNERRGIASQLVRHAVLDAEKQGCYKICLYCKPDLVSCYEQFDFGLKMCFCKKE